MYIATALAILVAAAANTYGLLAVGRPTLAVLFGVLAPLGALAEWWVVRKRTDLRPAAVADRMLISLLVAFLGITFIVAS